MPLMAELGLCKPTLRKLLGAVRHILPPENPQLQHLLRRELRLEFRMKVLPFGFGQFIAVIPLHQIVDDDFDGFFSHMLKYIIWRIKA